LLYVTYIAETLGTVRSSQNAVEAQERDIQIFMGHYLSGEAEKSGALTGGTVLYDWLFDSENPHKWKLEVLADDVYVVVAYLSSMGRNSDEICRVIDKVKGMILVAELPRARPDELKVYAKLEDSKKEFIGLRSKAGISNAKEQGKNIGGLRSKTESLNDARKMEAESNAEKIKEHLTFCIDKGYTLQAIADYLNTKGFKTAQGKDFKPMTVKRYIDRLTVSIQLGIQPII
jgi:hypothetical protein